MDEEAYQWVRDVATLFDEERLLPYAAGIDINTDYLVNAWELGSGGGGGIAVRAGFLWSFQLSNGARTAVVGHRLPGL